MTCSHRVDTQCLLCLQGSLHFDRIIGDGTGLMEIYDGHNVTIDSSNLRTHIRTHTRLYHGATLILPDMSYFELVTDIQGMVSGVQTLFVRGHTTLYHTGSMSSGSGATDGHYWLTEITVLNSGYVEVAVSSAPDLDRGIHLEAELFDVDYGGKVSINGAFTVSAARVNIEKAAVIDGTGYTSSAGPGSGPDRTSGGGGAGYGGSGGYSGGVTYGGRYQPKEKGSGGGNRLACRTYYSTKSGGTGGAAVRFGVSILMSVEGWLKMNGASGQPAAGGGSGGAIWLDASYLEGWGKLHATGGTATRVYVHSYSPCSSNTYGGGGGGGRIRAVTPRYGNKVVLNRHRVTGGTAASQSYDGSSGTWTVNAGNECSGHGVWTMTSSCQCNNGYVGDDCQYSCDADVTCSGHGTCGDHGQCVCDTGRAGYHCEYACDPTTTCSGHGHCSPCGICVCDGCFHGDDCFHKCHGGGQCIADRCVCDSCHLGMHCESTCNGHGVCVDGSNNSSRCKCDATWRGELCTRPGCPGDTEDCSGNGLCNAADHVCYCNPGWSGTSTYG